MGGARPKQFMLLGGIPILARTINNFAAALPGAEIVVVLPAEHTGFWHNLSARFEVAPHTVAEGGRERFHSVKNGLAALKRDPELIRRTVAAAAEHGTAIPVIEPVDSFRETDGAASQIIDRRCLRIVQTPQVFRAELLRRAYETEYRPEFTDDASVYEHNGGTIRLIDGEISNIKITHPNDLAIAEMLIKE